MSQNMLRHGKSRSCGCLAVKLRTEHGNTIGGIPTPEYRCWTEMKQRCLNPRKDFFAIYGGRGIKVCERWLSSFDNFLADMGRRPPGTSLDRRDTNGNYEPGNCRWATPMQQQHNIRSNHLITINGETRCVQEWNAVLGFSRGLISNRMRRGWSAEEALATPCGVRGRTFPREKRLCAFSI